MHKDDITGIQDNNIIIGLMAHKILEERADHNETFGHAFIQLKSRINNLDGDLQDNIIIPAINALINNAVQGYMVPIGAGANFFDEEDEANNQPIPLNFTPDLFNQNNLGNLNIESQTILTAISNESWEQFRSPEAQRHAQREMSRRERENEDPDRGR
jgi:hypothetical protein